MNMRLILGFVLAVFAFAGARAEPLPGLETAEAPRAIPLYDFWFHRLSAQPAPANAAAIMPRLRAAFAAEGAPPGLAWIAELESGLNPSAEGSGEARGLFQITPATARAIGLSTLWSDSRLNPEESARAVARNLRGLHEKFGSWPLALAAYNAGEGTVRRALAAHPDQDYAAIAPRLPSRTRIFVAKVCALVAIRTK
jgi:membrane-bound lytic murein transglycosylase D